MTHEVKIESKVGSRTASVPNARIQIWLKVLEEPPNLTKHYENTSI